MSHHSHHHHHRTMNQVLHSIPQQEQRRQYLAAFYHSRYTPAPSVQAQPVNSPAQTTISVPAAPTISQPIPTTPIVEPNEKESNEIKFTDIKLTPDQFCKYFRLLQEGKKYIDAKVDTGDIKQLNGYERSYLMNKYVEIHSNDMTLVELAKAKEAKIPERIEHDFDVKKRRFMRKIREAQEKALLANRVYNLVKIVAIGCVATFAAPLAVPMIASFGIPGAAFVTGAACAATDAICQTTAIELGIQARFSVNEVLETALGSGFGTAAAGCGILTQAVISGAGGAVTQIAEIEMGTREKFDLKAVGLQAASSLVSSAVKEIIPVINHSIKKVIPEAVNTVGENNLDLVANAIVSSTANSGVNCAVMHTPFSIDGVLMNSLGAILGNKLGNFVKNNSNIQIHPDGEVNEKAIKSSDNELSNDLNLSLDEITPLGVDERKQSDSEMKCLDEIINTLEAANSDYTSNTESVLSQLEGLSSELKTEDLIKSIPDKYKEIPSFSCRSAEESAFTDGLTTTQKIALGALLTVSTLVMLPEEVVTGIILVLGRLGAALPAGPIPEVLAVDGMAGEALELPVVGTTVGNAVSKILGKMGLFKVESRSTNAVTSKEISGSTLNTNGIVNGAERASNSERILDETEHFVPSGSAGSVRAWTTKARLKTVNLPTKGKIRYVPREGYIPSMPLPRGENGGYVDRFGNEWIKGPSRTMDQPFEWDVQLSNLGKKQLGWATRDESHLNISLDGRITHK